MRLLGMGGILEEARAKGGPELSIAADEALRHCGHKLGCIYSYTIIVEDWLYRIVCHYIPCHYCILVYSCVCACVSVMALAAIGPLALSYPEVPPLMTSWSRIPTHFFGLKYHSNTKTCVFQIRIDKVYIRLSRTQTHLTWTSWWTQIQIHQVSLHQLALSIAIPIHQNHKTRPHKQSNLALSIPIPIPFVIPIFLWFSYHILRETAACSSWRGCRYVSTPPWLAAANGWRKKPRGKAAHRLLKTSK